MEIAPFDREHTSFY